MGCRCCGQTPHSLEDHGHTDFPNGSQFSVPPRPVLRPQCGAPRDLLRLREALEPPHREESPCLKTASESQNAVPSPQCPACSTCCELSSITFSRWGVAIWDAEAGDVGEHRLGRDSPLPSVSFQSSQGLGPGLGHNPPCPRTQPVWPGMGPGTPPVPGEAWPSE